MALRKMSVDIDFRIDLSEINKLDSSVDDVVKSVTGGMKKAEKNIDGVSDEFRDVGSSANESDRHIDLLTSSLEELGKMSSSLDKISKEISNIGKESKDAEGKVDGLASKLGGGLKAGLAGIGVAAAGLVAGFLATGEASQETMEDMGKLETAFTTSGHSAEAGMKSYEGLVGILGETDQAVEAANHLAKLTDNEEDLAKWTDICTGVYATFGDSLPIEGLTEAA